MSNLEHFPQYAAYYCNGCREYIEIPLEIPGKKGERSLAIRHNPENFLIWREQMERLHSTCGTKQAVN